MLSASSHDPSTPPLPNLNTHPLSASASPIITEINDKDSVAGLDFTQNGVDARTKLVRNNSITNRVSRFARQLSFNSKSDSPSLPKRNQPITSSAPSTLTKKNLESDDKKEVYV